MVKRGMGWEGLWGECEKEGKERREQILPAALLRSFRRLGYYDLSVWQCESVVRTTAKAYMEITLVTLKPLNRSSPKFALQNFVQIRPGDVSPHTGEIYLLKCKFFWFFLVPTGEAPKLILTQNTSKDAVPCNVPFGIFENQNQFLAPFFSKKRHFETSFGGTEHFRPKIA